MWEPSNEGHRSSPSKARKSYADMDNDREIIQEDQLKHPNCRYSVYLSKSCRSKNGEYVCEELKKIDRVCPGQKPVNIYSNSRQFDGDQNSSNDAMKLPFDPFAGLKGFDLSDLLPPAQNKVPDGVPVPKDGEGFKFSWGGSLFDNDSDGSKKEGGVFGFLKERVPKDKDEGTKPKPPPSGTSVGPSEDI